MKIQEIPVLLLTGYLGSGKTTLVNRILSNTKGIKFAVIVNDIGEVNIDASLIEQGGVVGQKDDSLVALQNGCICCTLKLDLVQQLNDIVSMDKFDYIVIEASGICEPAPIAQTICAYPELYPQLAKNGIAKLDSIVTAVDALRLRDEFGGGKDLLKENIGEDDLERLVIEQIEFCNTIIINKIAEVTPEELTKVKKIIRALQPKANILECNYGDVDLDLILGTGQFNFEEVATSASWIAELEGDHDEDEHEHHHHHHHDHPEGIENEESGEALEYNIQTFVYYRRPAMDLGLFDDFVARRWPKNVIRSKGICYFNDEKNKCYVFEQAGKQVQIRDAGQWYATMPADQLEQMKAQTPALRRDWDETYGDRMQKLVFIGQNLDQEAITKELDACLRD
ncbi:GTP-binding protein [Hoylesella buccalis]|uniref:CobW family GTP-binding protein n=1 Tax=Hoylesella buccalis TaxID=28127 RepID=UPI001D084713|nr:GTP-binding protein [Hoylesella buccalis]MCB6901407.1 GTP-binding protein [Hoylesella buccalis]UEA61867.1 GTP-binding protein [Hoylesella buccalis]UWP48415.1 GTP-binding protein [Hoylesella buccalis ATCC 35310]